MTQGSLYFLTATRRLAGAFLATVALAGSVSAADTAAAQRSFASPQEAVEALAAAVGADDAAAQLVRVLGPHSADLVSSGDPVADTRGRERFLSSFGKANRIEMDGADRAVLIIGEKSWPFPIPIVRAGDGWRFDTEAGAEEILDRRVGRNELNAIEVSRATVDAQLEYASADRNGDGILEYASRFRSTPGRNDGLYWPAAADEPPSPMGPLMASAQAAGYWLEDTRGIQHEPYHGYYYRILLRQGPDAPGGAYEYVVKERMIGGFALVAFPAKYGASGIMTFVVNHDGVVYQKDLGPDTGTIAEALSEFNPDPSWAPVADQPSQ
jgi:hypothetical protein